MMKKELLAYEHHKESTDIIQCLGSRHVERILKKKKSDLLSLEQLLAESNHMNSSSSAGVAEAS